MKTGDGKRVKGHGEVRSGRGISHVDDDDEGTITQFRGKKGRHSNSSPSTRPPPPRELDIRALDFHGRTNKATCPYNLRHSNRSNQLQDHQINSYLSNLGDFNEGFDSSEASRKNYATIALNYLNSLKTWNPSTFKGELSLVECGPIVIAHSSAGLILHFNFKARNIEVSSAPVETYFTELIKSDTNDVQIICVSCLGPSCSLPAKAETFGCLYCSSHNIHHPDITLLPGFHNGREDHGTTLESQTEKLCQFRRKSKEEGITRMFSHPGLKYFGRYYSADPAILANVALSLFNSRTKGTNFKLVRVGSSGLIDASLGILVHLNFEAKNKHDPEAPLQTFFAEVARGSWYAFATFCECLGPSDFILPEEPEKYGCTICGRARVHHPSGPGYLNGREYEDL